MRVLAVTNLFPNPLQPHLAAFNRQQFGALAMEHDVEVIAPVAWTSELSGWRGTERLPEDRRLVRDGAVVHYPRYVFTPRMLRGMYGRFLAGSIRGCFHRVIDRFRPDIVLGCWAYPDGWAAVQLAREAGLPVAIKVHGSDLLTVGEQPGKQRGTEEAIRTCDAVIAVSRHLGDRAVKMGAASSRVHVVYNGVDTRLFSPGCRDAAREQLGITSADPLILFVGNLVPVKGLDVLLDALAAVKRAGGRFQCVLVGDGPLRGELLSRIDALGLGGRVRLAGSSPLDRLAYWYRAADLFVLPSRSEGVPNVLLEAAACGTPFIASRVGGIPEIADFESLVSPEDVDELADRIGMRIGGHARSPAPPAFAPGGWADSARYLATILEGVVADSKSRAARAA